MSSHVPVQAPRATYRLQFTEQFRLRDAVELTPYLRDLGISHLYASPLLKATPHSTHGYDVCDFSQLNPELGSEADFSALIAALHEHGMGLVLDIVPNHMGIGTPENHWWWGVLTHGEASPYAEYFDINWQATDPRISGKVLLPVLADYYHRELENGKIQLHHEAGVFTVHYPGQQFPLNPGSVEALRAQTIPGKTGPPSKSGSIEKRAAEEEAEVGAAVAAINADPGAVDAILRRQFYRLTYWRHGDAELNYRRFFAITTLAGICVEKKKVFADSHQLVLEWTRKGWVNGLRVDHPDGLRNPEEYLKRLRQQAPEAWIVVEKILEPGESLPPTWPVAGTTGYDFISRMDGLFLDRNGGKTLTDFYRKFTGEPVDYSGIVRDRQLFILKRLFRAEVGGLARLLAKVTGGNWRWTDFSPREIGEVIEEMAASFPVYRTYVDPNQYSVSSQDKERIEQTTATAKKNRPDLPPELFDFCRDVLLLKWRGEMETEFVLRFQQLTVSTMAKGVEDTAFYSFNRFIALNEVGDDPGKFGLSIRDFHAACAEQQKKWPDSMLATSTHDTKRSEDVRARLNVISEIPGRWSEAVLRWAVLNERHRRGDWPDRNAEYLFYQTLAGAWPLSVERAVAYMEKATREAKQYTDWAKPNEEYHKAVNGFIEAALGDAEFTRDLESFLEPIKEAGLVNSLAQTMLKLTLPGVPDFYQGSELLDFSLVDPDNRRPVDFEARRSALNKAKDLSAEDAWELRQTGMPNIWLIQRVLALRAKEPEMFAGSSSYEPLLASGAKGHHAVGFIRNGEAIVVVPRLTLTLNNDWADTVMALPGAGWKNELTGEEYKQDMVALSALFRHFPVALLTRKKRH